MLLVIVLDGIIVGAVRVSIAVELAVVLFYRYTRKNETMHPYHTHYQNTNQTLRDI
jgi:hypothetical protein